MQTNRSLIDTISVYTMQPRCQINNIYPMYKHYLHETLYIHCISSANKQLHAARLACSVALRSPGHKARGLQLGVQRIAGVWDMAKLETLAAVWANRGSSLGHRVLPLLLLLWCVRQLQLRAAADTQIITGKCRSGHTQTSQASAPADPHTSQASAAADTQNHNRQVSQRTLTNKFQTSATADTH
jgi:hypothetical protein